MTKPKESLTVPARPEQSEGPRPLRGLRGLPPRKPGSVVRRYLCVAERRHRRPSHRRVGVPLTSRRSLSTGRLPRTLRLLAEVPRSRGTKPTLRANPYLHAHSAHPTPRRPNSRTGRPFLGHVHQAMFPIAKLSRPLGFAARRNR